MKKDEGDKALEACAIDMLDDENQGVAAMDRRRRNKGVPDAVLLSQAQEEIKKLRSELKQSLAGCHTASTSHKIDPAVTPMFPAVPSQANQSGFYSCAGRAW